VILAAGESRRMVLPRTEDSFRTYIEQLVFPIAVVSFATRNGRFARMLLFALRR
jgi:hypothetical protein